MKESVSGLALVLLFVSLFGCDSTPSVDSTLPEDDSTVVAANARTMEFESYTELETLFLELGYTQESWQEGVREVPRLELKHIPERWGSSTSKSVSVQKKKALFFRLLGPLVLRANELIQEERSWLVEQKGAEPSPRIQLVYEHYRVRDGDFDELLARVDSVPVSLVLAQAAEESGWGTSRFATLGNALFGQWTYDEGIEPLQRRTKKGQYRIAAFDSPLDSVIAYMRNINSHRAYRELRRVRSADRHEGNSSSGHELAKTLIGYSERGEAYIQSLHTIMRVNQLGPTDRAYLAAGEAIYLVPVTR